MWAKKERIQTEDLELRKMVWPPRAGLLATEKKKMIEHPVLYLRSRRELKSYSTSSSERYSHDSPGCVKKHSRSLVLQLYESAYDGWGVGGFPSIGHLGEGRLDEHR
ncbi:hypothetical protein MRX96_025121 [Rhipicephalus microplus]